MSDFNVAQMATIFGAVLCFILLLMVGLVEVFG